MAITREPFPAVWLLVWLGSLVCLFAEPLPNQTTRYPGTRRLPVCWFGLLLTIVRLAIPAEFCFDRVAIRSNAIQRAIGGRAQAWNARKQPFSVSVAIGCRSASVATDTKIFWLKSGCLYKPTLGPGKLAKTKYRKIAIFRFCDFFDFFVFCLRYCAGIPLPILCSEPRRFAAKDYPKEQVKE